MIIDIHTHIHNFNDVPIKGNLDARIWEIPSIILEKLIEMKLIKNENCWLNKKSENENNINIITETKIIKELENIFLETNDENIKELIAYCQNRKNRSMNIFQRISNFYKSLCNLKDWLELNSGSHEKILEKMFTTYSDVDLFIPLMMDMEYWLNDNTIGTSIHKQIKCLKGLVTKYAGKIHPFIAFNPERIRRNPELEFNIIKEAIEKDGFIGIKVYPPLGYKPMNNNKLEDGIKISKNSKKYGEIYDNILNKLFKYCSDPKNDIPITTHCNSGGAEAYKNSGKLSHPKYWETVLKKYPNLRINFAHFGGDDRLLGNGDDWSEKIMDLMRSYKNVYSDISFHVSILNNNKEYIKELESRFEDYPALKQRLMYGSDWHMLSMKNNYELYLKNTLKLYQDNFFDKDVKDFFYNNAINFLGLKPGNRTQERLLTFYKNMNKSINNLPNWLLNK